MCTQRDAYNLSFNRSTSSRGWPSNICASNIQLQNLKTRALCAMRENPAADLEKSPSRGHNICSHKSFQTFAWAKSKDQAPKNQRLKRTHHAYVGHLARKSTCINMPMHIKALYSCRRRGMGRPISPKCMHTSTQWDSRVELRLTVQNVPQNVRQPAITACRLCQAKISRILTTLNTRIAAWVNHGQSGIDTNLWKTKLCQRGIKCLLPHLASMRSSQESSHVLARTNFGETAA